MVECIEVKEADLDDLVQRVTAGEEVMICRGGRPVARLIAAGEQPRRRQLGSAKGLFEVTDAFFEPLPEELLRAFEGEDDE
jgi:antitoxin (DNA-binding transcriptional repressor) of toxin-antitoxin stability system